MTMREQGIIGAIVGTVIGLLVSGWTAFVAAPSAVKVRPRLEQVDLITAAATGHGFDWVFYHTPVVATLVVVVFLAAASAIMFMSV